MKKFIAILIIVLIYSNSFALDNLAVQSIQSAWKVYDATSKTWNVPAMVKGSTGAIQAIERVALVIPPARGATIVQALAAAGIAYAGTKLIDYLAGQAFSFDPTTGAVRKVITSNSSYGSSSSRSQTDILGHFSGNQISGVVYAPWGTGDPYYYIQSMPDFQNSIIDMGSLWAPGYVDSLGVSWYIRSYRPFNSPSGPFTLVASPLTTSNQVAVIPGNTTYSTPGTNEISTVAEASLTAGDPAAVAALGESFTPIENALNSPGDALNKSASMPAIQTALNSSIPGATTTNLENKIAAPTAAADMTSAANRELYKPLTQDQTKQAVEDALNDDKGVAIPVNPDVITPTKLSLTTIMQSFMESINNLPVMTTLRGLTIVASGSSTLCVNLPVKYGGNSCWNASGIQGSLNMIGTALLSITTLMCFIEIFRG